MVRLLLLLLDVSNHVLGNSTCRPDIVAIFPQATSTKIPLFDFRVTFQNRSSRVACELLGNLGRTPFRVSLHEQLNVVRSNLHFHFHFHFHNLVTEPFSSPFEQLRKFVSNSLQHPLAVLPTPHEVILTQTNRICMTSVLFYSNLYFYYHLIQ